MFESLGFEPDWFGLLGREVLRERRAALIAEACAWSVGLSDRPHHLRLRGRLVATGSTIGDRAATGQALSGEEDGRLELGDARPGSFQDALNAVDADGAVFADRFDREVIEPFVHETCVLAADRARRTRPGQWAELLDDLGEDGAELGDVVRAGEWEQPLRTDAEHLVLAALGTAPLLEVEAEGLPLSLVRAAEATARAAAAPRPEPEPEDLSGALFLALAAVREAGLPAPVPADDAPRLLAALAEQGLEPDEVAAVLPHLDLAPGTADRVAALLAAA
ncbi:hypothetical protein SAMN05660464_0623 [Geodermatophilus dictyosporus]|uniref:Uncharacterized protein n=1 Tax=Geodermatophilus dictyosporus TaxID=1523247 RepID=A0A1I5JC14_9ACTN|nr:hypothetical protein [Geodermatophilus dictyosporus]SFO70170.1 hypothetical protein SAMN05660464_0623 [Geodermatophilus dictyosporus]